MIVRNCAGGVVFSGDQVFLLKNDKEEWVLPKGVIREKQDARDVALLRVRDEAGITAEIVTDAGNTTYEFYSQTRRQPVCNRVRWYVMCAQTRRYRIAFEQGFRDGDWFPFEEALDKITYTQDKELLRRAYERLMQEKNQ